MANLAAAMIIASGIATRYDPGVMDEVVENRTRWGHLDPDAQVAGYVALLDCDRLGELVWLQAPGGRVLGPVMVADCAQDAHRDGLLDRGIVVDLSWELALVLGVVDAPVGGFTVWDADPSHNYWNEFDRAADPLSLACHPANGAGGLEQCTCSPAPSWCVSQPVETGAGRPICGLSASPCNPASRSWL